MFLHRLQSAKLALFVLLSGMDLFLTWQLLNTSGGGVYESNPIAHWWLSHAGWFGLACFKAAAVLAVAVFVTALAKPRPIFARRLLSFACLALVGVVGYSYSLTQTIEDHACSPEDVVLAAKRGMRIEQERGIHDEYRTTVERLASLLVEERISLEDAVGQLAQVKRARDPKWMRILQKRYFDRSPEECLAANLIDFIVGEHKNPLTVQALTDRMRQDYLTSYGEHAPGIGS